MKKLTLLFALIAATGLTYAQQLKSDGSIVDSHNSTIGYLKSDGTVEDSHHSTIGYLKSDGTMENSHHSTVGKASGNKMEAAVKQFFFKK